MENSVELQGLALFQDIEADKLTAMLSCLGALAKKFRKSEFIFLEGDKLQHIGVLVEGTIFIVKEDIRGHKAILDTVKSGGLFGESFVCGEVENSSVSFQAASDCRVLFLSFQRVLRFCDNSCVFHQKLVENMVKILAQRNVLMLNKMEIISQKTIRERLFTWFTQQSQVNSSRSFVSPMGRMELAEYLCVDRSALTRELAKMKKDGLIDFDKTTYSVKELKL